MLNDNYRNNAVGYAQAHRHGCTGPSWGGGGHLVAAISIRPRDQVLRARVAGRGLGRHLGRFAGAVSVISPQLTATHVMASSFVSRSRLFLGNLP